MIHNQELRSSFARDSRAQQQPSAAAGFQQGGFANVTRVEVPTKRLSYTLKSEVQAWIDELGMLEPQLNGVLDCRWKSGENGVGSAGNSYRPPRNVICVSCFEGAKAILDLARQLEQDWRDDTDRDKCKTLVTRQGLTYAFKQMKVLEQVEEEASEKLEFLESLVDAFRDGVHADVELITNDGLSLHAHRVVMATKSPVFKAMFEADRMKKEHTGAIHIEELSHDQLRFLLEFLYCAEIPDEKMAEHAHSLLIAADKYDIPVLSKVCEAYIATTVSPVNVLEILELSTLCSASSLKETAISVILKSYEDVVFSKEYEDFAMKNPLLAVEITKALVRDLKK
ncbi:hypothetical protein R1flu_021731 [Riccia fluitans]|uniref:BTB domain-containing protein n=1 Tax=Riccia fluitans TaxID=41844 RepID=A0ABD1ZQ88_9MARC